MGHGLLHPVRKALGRGGCSEPQEDQTALSFIDRRLQPYYLGSYMDVLLQAVEQGRDLEELYAVVDRASAVLENDYWQENAGHFSRGKVEVIREFLRLVTPLDEAFKEALKAWA